MEKLINYKNYQYISNGTFPNVSELQAPLITNAQVSPTHEKSDFRSIFGICRLPVFHVSPNIFMEKLYIDSNVEIKHIKIQPEVYSMKINKNNQSCSKSNYENLFYNEKSQNKPIIQIDSDEIETLDSETITFNATNKTEIIIDTNCTVEPVDKEIETLVILPDNNNLARIETSLSDYQNDSYMSDNLSTTNIICESIFDTESKCLNQLNSAKSSTELYKSISQLSKYSSSIRTDKNKLFKNNKQRSEFYTASPENKPNFLSIKNVKKVKYKSLNDQKLYDTKSLTTYYTTQDNLKNKLPKEISDIESSNLELWTVQNSIIFKKLFEMWFKEVVKQEINLIILGTLKLMEPVRNCNCYNKFNKFKTSNKAASMLNTKQPDLLIYAQYLPKKDNDYYLSAFVKQPQNTNYDIQTDFF